METASHPLDRFLEVVRGAGKALKAETPLVANTGEPDPHRAMALLEAGWKVLHGPSRFFRS